MWKKNKIVIVIIVLVVLISCYMISFVIDDSDSNTVIANEVVEKIETSEEVEEMVKVDIKGAIKSAGVYEVSTKSRVIDVINLAGGLSKSANTEYINLAKLVEDEMIIWIYTNDEIKKFKESDIIYKYIEKECNCPSVESSACINNDSSEKININTATKEELMTLPGVGESKAVSIIEYRSNNSFETIEDIKNVSGIGDSAFESIKDYITV